MPAYGGCHDTAGRLTEGYREHCSRIGIPLELNGSVRPPPGDASTLFVSAGTQRFKPLFLDESHRGTIANIQTRLRLNDLDEVGDGSHFLCFRMMGLFSFREMPLPDCILFWHGYLRDMGIRPTHVTVHPDKFDEWRHFHPPGSEVRPDADCTWSHDGVSGYSTEFFVGDLELGNVVNPLGDCIDVGFGLERLCLVLGDEPPSPDDMLREGILGILEAGYLPGKKEHGYALRRLLRSLWKRGGTLDHPVFRDEAERQRKLAETYGRLLPRFPGRSPGWWFDTHGIDVRDV